MLLDALKGGYNLIAEYSMEMIDLFDRESFNYIYASPANYRLLGFTPEELMGQHGLGLVHPEEMEYAQSLLSEGLKKGSVTGEFRERKKDGSYIWVDVQGYLIKRVEQPDYIMVITRDINERRLAEEALRNSEQRLREITDNMMDGIAMFNRDGVIDYVSPSCQNLLGYSQEEMLCKPNLDLVHPEDRRHFLYVVNQAIRKQSSVRLEFRCRHAEGYYIWLEAVGNVLIDENNRHKGLVVAFRDIEARKQAEQKVRENESRLVEQYNCLNTLFNNMNEFCYTYDENFNITFVNKKTTDGTGYSQEEMIGRCIFDFVHPDDREQVRSFAEQRLKEIKVNRYEHRLICKNGQELLVHIKGSPLVNNGKATGAVILCDDITEYKKLQAEMTRLDQMHTLGEIAAGIAHEVRNPMTTVNGFLQLLLKDGEFNDKREYLEIMIEELNRANGILGEFLNLARNKIVDLKPCQINQIIRSLAPLLQADAFLSDRTILLKLGDVPDLLLDVKEIRQLIINLVRNALEATPRGGMVEITTRQEKNIVSLSIKDQGKGIPEDIKEKLGTPFFSTKDTGTGLGLAICFGIIERHKAKLEVDSTPSGTTFTVKFDSVPER